MVLYFRIKVNDGLEVRNDTKTVFPGVRYIQHAKHSPREIAHWAVGNVSRKIFIAGKSYKRHRFVLSKKVLKIKGYWGRQCSNRN